MNILSYTYEYVTRDTYGFAMKATAGKVNGEYRAISKDPVTDSGTKKSAVGFLKVEKDAEGEFVLVDNLTFEQSDSGELKPVYKDGRLLYNDSLENIRKRLK